MNRLRRRVIGAAAGLAALPLARAQSGPRTIRVVAPDEMPERARGPLRENLARAAQVDIRNLRIEFAAFGQGPPELVEARASEIVASRPDLIFMAFEPETVLLRHLTRQIPIVFFSCPFDPARAGLIETIARPGGNVTGAYFDLAELHLKRWSLFKEVLPKLKRGAWLTRASSVEAPRWKNREAAEAYRKGFLLQEREANRIAESRLGIRITEIVVPDDATEEQVIAAVRRVRPEAMRMSFDTKKNGAFDRFLVSERILNEFVVRAGFLPREGWDAAVAMAERILRGEFPATIPAVQSTRYVVKLNPRLAREMGIEIPPSVQLRAEIIEG